MLKDLESYKECFYTARDKATYFNPFVKVRNVNSGNLEKISTIGNDIVDLK